MLLEFAFKNFFSFKEGAVISFKLDAKCPEAVSCGKSFATVLCVKGGNASGKTQVLKALSFLRSFVSDSFLSEPDKLIPFDSFFFNEDPTEFYVEFEHRSIRYFYELELTDRAVIRETLYKCKQKKTKILERTVNSITVKTRPLSKLDNMALRSNVSLFSMAKHYQLGIEDVDNVLEFFSIMTGNVNYSGMSDKRLSHRTVSKLLHDQPNVREWVTSFLKECDTGITRLDFHEIEEEHGKKAYEPIFLHSVESNEYPISYFGESSGTRSLYQTLPIYVAVLNTGGVLALDEFDINLHPHILPKLLKLFLDPTVNTRNAQLIFSTHDAEIIELTGRYRTYLINKDNNESYAYRLDEIPGDVIRNDRAILPAYNAGKLGGVPKI